VATYGVSPEDEGSLRALFEASPDVEIHTSAAAETGFLLGLVALVAAPFSVMYAVSVGAGGLGFFFAFVGLATTSRPHVAGRALAPLGLALAFTALVLVGLRFLGLDTAFGDGLVPTIGGWLENVNARFPQP
jgi:hypothetical protein